MQSVDCEILILGAGPAGLSAALAAARCGKSVIILDDNPRPGGQIWRDGPPGLAPPARQTVSSGGGGTSPHYAAERCPANCPPRPTFRSLRNRRRLRRNPLAAADFMLRRQRTLAAFSRLDATQCDGGRRPAGADKTRPTTQGGTRGHCRQRSSSAGGRQYGETRWREYCRHYRTGPDDRTGPFRNRAMALA